MVMLVEYGKHIELAIDYIENNIQEKLTVSRCAKSCGYSEYHFLRIFRLVTGYTPMDYVRKRRLCEATRELSNGRKPIIEIALSWGFDSLENFIRAFQTEHGITPGAYRLKRNSLHLFDPKKGRYNHKNKNMELEPLILKIDTFTLCGYAFSTNSGDKHYDIPRFWNHYHVKGLGDKFNYLYHPEDRNDIGLLEFCSDDEYNYIIGVDQKEDKPGPDNTVKITIPAARYAVFNTPPADSFTFVETIHDTWNYIYSKWLPESTYKRSNGFDFECYCEESRTYSQKIYIPIENK